MADSETLRQLREEDLPELLRTAQAVDVGLWGRPETDLDDLADELAVTGSLATCTRAAVSDDRIDGFVVVRGRECALTVHPEPSGADRRQVATRLLTWAAEAGGADLDLAAPDRELQDVALALGWQPTHRSHELVRQRTVPSPDLPPGIHLGDLRDDAHARAVHRMLYRFWAEVPTHHDRPYEEWRALFLDHHSADPGLQLVAWQDDAVVGAAICRTFTTDTGWILQLGVAPTHRRRGLGRALLCLASDRLQALPGVREVGLSVDAVNDAALDLYRSAGFRVERTYLRYSR